MASRWIDQNRAKLEESPTIRDHLLVEATEAAFESRDDVIENGESLLSRALVVNESSADRRGSGISILTFRPNNSVGVQPNTCSIESLAD